MMFWMISFIFLFSTSLQAATIQTLKVVPQDQSLIVESIIPFKKGDEFSEGLLEVSKKSLLATNRFESSDLKWDKESGTLRITVIPRIFIEDVKWTGSSVAGRGNIEEECLPSQLEANLTQETRSKISRCILNKINGRGYLDAKIFLSIQDNILFIEVDRGERYKISDVFFTGVLNEKDSRLESRLSNQTNKFFSPAMIEEDLKELKDYYLSRDYYLIKVFPPNVQIDPNTKEVFVRWRVKEGPVYDIDFVGDVTTRSVLKDVISREGDVPDWFIDEVVDLQIEKLREEGYVDVEVTAKQERRDKAINVEIKTQRGSRYRLTDPDWIGLSDRKSVESLFRNISNQRSGTYFNETKFKESFEDQFLEALYKRGYLEIEVKGIDFIILKEDAKVTPIIYMNEGPLYHIEQSVMLGVPFEFRDLQEVSDLEDEIKKGRRYRVEVVEDLTKSLNQNLIALGYLDAESEIKIIKKNGNVDLSIIVKTGPRYKISKILIRGTYKTDYDVLKNEVEIEEGEFYSQDDVDDSISAILRLGVARSVDITIFDKNATRAEAILLVDISEAARFRFEVGPGYGTIDGVRATFRGTWANIGGRARRITLFAKANREIKSAKVPSITDVKSPQKTPFVERTITVEYFEPSLFYFPFDGRLSYTHAKKSENKFDQLQNTFASILDYRLSRNWLFSTYYSLEFSKTFNVAIEDNPFQVEAGFSRFTSIGQQITGKYLDDDFNPSKGWKGFLEAEIYEKLLGGDSNLWKMRTKQDFFYPLYTIKKGSHIGLALSALSGIADAYPAAENVPVEKRFFVGGEGTVRGYDEQSINPNNFTGGESMFVFRSEVSFPVYWDISLLGFFDGGNAYTSINDFNPFDLRYGVGAGLRWDTIVGPLKVGYGFIVNRQIDNRGNKEPLGNFYIGVGPL